LKFVTGSPEVLSLASSFPRPCGYLLFRFVQFLYKTGIRAPAVATVGPKTTHADDHQRHEPPAHHSTPPKQFVLLAIA
jgi:hypothetical protein